MGDVLYRYRAQIRHAIYTRRLSGDGESRWIHVENSQDKTAVESLVKLLGLRGIVVVIRIM